jgi:hypothetical protein
VNIDEYQTKAFATARIDWSDARKRHIPTFGVIGELGSITSELKKSLRDGKAYTEGTKNRAEEFGDVLWYLAAIASHNDVRLGGLGVTVGSQRHAPKSQYRHIYHLVASVAALVAVLDEVGPTPTSRQKPRLAGALKITLRATLEAIRQEKLDLTTVLRENIRKVKGAFGERAPRPARCFDRTYPDYERLPRSIGIHFLERPRGPGRLEVVLKVNGLNIGDRLTDNARQDDGYRFHDAFHLAYCAVLGWSPVVRATFRCKRKTNPRVDEVEDGARAAIVEEALAQTVFNYARDHSMLRELDRIDHNLLKLIQRMVSELEVRVCALHEWQDAIFVGFEAFRSLKANHGGWLVLDAEQRSLTYSKEGPIVG